MEEQVIKIQAVVRGNLARRKQYALHPQLLKRNLRKKLKEDYEIWTRLDMNFLDDDFYHSINKRATLKQNNTYKHDTSKELQQEKQAEIYTSGSEKSEDSFSSRSEKSEKEENIISEGEKDKEAQETIVKGDVTGSESKVLEGINELRNCKREESEKVEKIEEIGKVEKIGDIEYENGREDRNEKKECNRLGIEIQEDEANRKLEENYNKLERMLDTSCYSNRYSPEDIRDISQTQYHMDSVGSVSLEELGQNDPFELNNSYIVKDSEFQHNIDLQGHVASSISIQVAQVDASHTVQDIVHIPTENNTASITSKNQTTHIPTENITSPQLENTEDMNQSWNERSMWEDQDLIKKQSSDSNAQFIIVVHNVSDQNIYNPYIESVHDEHKEGKEDQNVSNVSCNKKIIFSFDVSRLDSEDSEDSEESEISMNMIYKDKEEGKTYSHIDGLIEKSDISEDKEMIKTEECTENNEAAKIDKREEQDQSQVDRNQPSSFTNRLFGTKNSSSDVMTNKKSESESSIPEQDPVQPSPINKVSLPEAIDKKPNFEIQPGYSEPEKQLDQESDYNVHKLEGFIIPLSNQESDKTEDKSSFIPISKEEDSIIAPSLLEPDSLEVQESLFISHKENGIAQLTELYEPGEPEAQDSSLSKVQEGENLISPIIDDFGKQTDMNKDIITHNKADRAPSEVLNIEKGIEIWHKVNETDDIKHEDSGSFPVKDKEENISLRDNLSEVRKHAAQNSSDIMNKEAHSSIQLSDQSEGQDSSISSSKHSISNSSKSSSHLDQAHSNKDRSASYSSKSYKSQSPKSSNDSKRSSPSSNPSLDSKSHLVESPTDQIPSQSLPIQPSNQSELPHPDPSSPHNSSLMINSISLPRESDHIISHQTEPQNASNSLSFSHRSDSHYRLDSFTQSTGKHPSKPSDQIVPNISINIRNFHDELESDFNMYSDAGIFIEDLKGFKIETSSMNNSRASFSRQHTLRGTAENSQFVNTDCLKSQSKLEVKCESGLAKYRELTPEQLAEEENLMLEEAVDQHGISSHNLIRDTPFKSSSRIKLAEIKSHESTSSHSHISATPSVIKHRVLQVTRHKAFNSTKNRPDLLKKDTRIDDNNPPLMIPKDTSSNPHQIPNKNSKSTLSNNKLDMPVINEQLANKFDSKAKLYEESIEAFNSPNLNSLKKQGSNMVSLPKLKKDYSSTPHGSAYTSGRLDQLLSPGSKLFMPPARLVSTAYQKEPPKPKFIDSPYSVGWTDKILKTFYDVKVEILQGKGSFKPKYKLKKASLMNLPNLKLKKEPSIALEPIKKEKKAL